MLLYTRPSAPRKPYQRSRNGCYYCKLKRKKCDETRPKCSRCVQKGEDCKYEDSRPREVARIAVNTRSALRDSASPASSDSQWDYPSDDWHDFSAHDHNCPMIGLWTEDSDYLADPVSDWVDSPATLSSEWPVTERFPGDALNTRLSDLESPAFMENTKHRRRGDLIDYFCNIFSHLLVFSDTEDVCNPLRKMIPQSSYTNSPLLDVLLAFSSSLLEHRDILSEEKTLNFHNKALQGLRKLIDDFEEANKEEVLSTIILLVYYEIFVRQSDVNIVNDHLKAAKMVINAIPKPSTLSTASLERAFYFYDVIVALSFDQPPIYSPPPKEIQPSIFDAPESFLNSTLSTVDILLGLFTNLWPIIHRLSYLRSSKYALEAAIAIGNSSEASVLRAEFESTARGIELALKAWKPVIQPHRERNKGPFEHCRLESVADNAEAYRCAALVYLYRDVHLYPRNSRSLQKWTHLSLMACSSFIDSATHRFDGPASGLLWPLFTAACNAIDLPDRELATAVFSVINQNPGTKNIVDAWNVVVEVWRKVDLIEWGGGDEVHWRDICQERSLTIVFG